MPPAIIAAGIGAAGAIGGSLISSHATGQASDAALEAQRENNALQKQIYDLNTVNETPFMSTGTNALGQLNAELQPGFDWNSYLSNNPQYKFLQQRGIGAVDASASAGGTLNSGGTLKALEEFGQGLASSSINDIQNRQQNLAGIGLTAANALAGVGTNYANAVSSNNNNAAGAIGNAALVNGNNQSALLGNALQQFRGITGLGNPLSQTPISFAPDPVLSSGPSLAPVSNALPDVTYG